MKEYRATLTINVFIKANSEEEAQQKFEDMDYGFSGDRESYDTSLIDSEITEVVG